MASSAPTSSASRGSRPAAALDVVVREPLFRVAEALHEQQVLRRRRVDERVQRLRLGVEVALHLVAPGERDGSDEHDDADTDRGRTHFVIVGCERPMSAPVRRTCAAALTVLASACSPSVTPPPETVLPSVSAATPTASTSAVHESVPTVVDRCAPHVDEARRDLVSKIPVHDAYSGRSFAERVCVQAGDDVFWIAYEDVRVSGATPADTHIQATWTLRHQSFRAGEDRRVASAKPTPLSIGPYAADWAHVSEGYDYDGDGSAEVVVAYGRSGPGFDHSRSTLWTFRTGAVIPYAPTAELDGVEVAGDLDGDGRPEISVLGPYLPEDSVSCGSLEGDPRQSNLIVCHALPDGTFSTTDAVARSANAAGCGADAKLVVTDDADGLASVRCARLRGESEATVVAAIRKVCVRQETKDCPPKAGSGACLHLDTMIAWAKATPPFRL